MSQVEATDNGVNAERERVRSVVAELYQELESTPWDNAPSVLVLYATRLLQAAEYLDTKNSS